MKEKVKSWIEILKKDKKKSLLFGVGIIIIIAIILLIVLLLQNNNEEATLKKYLSMKICTMNKLVKMMKREQNF